MLQCRSLLQLASSLPRAPVLGVLAASIMQDRTKGKRRFERPLVFGSKTGDGAIASKVIRNTLSKRKDYLTSSQKQQTGHVRKVL